jgi:4-hydroxy-4-methyl-2-oxoglutarate aldolase
MIEDPPLLTIRRNFPRPSDELIAGFSGVPTGNVVDAMGGLGCLDCRIKPLVQSSQVMVGTAVTCYAGPSDGLAVFGALHAARRGDIVVAATDAFTHTAIAGDLLLGMARNRGVAGFVTDGSVRDLAGVLAVGLPVYCAGLTANSAARNGPGTVGLPIVVGGVAVESGDILVGDRDGVVVVPLKQAQAVLAKLADVRAAEASLEAKVKAGLEIPDFVSALINSDRVRDIK